MEYARVLIQFFYDWQTLIAGMAALFGAWITIRALRAQAKEDAERRLRATRAMLPATLDAVYDYSIATIRWLKSTKEKADLLEKGNYTNQPLSMGTCPRPDGGMVRALQDCVENFNITEARFIGELLSKIQIHQSRIASLADYFENHMLYYSKRVGVVRNIDESIADAAEITAYAFRAFPFARNEREDIDATLDIDAIRTAFRLCHIGEVENVDAWNIATNKYMPPPLYKFTPNT